MELFEAIHGRRSIRIFENKKPAAAAIKKIIDAAIWAPSACNRQGWRFIVIDDAAILNKITDAGGALFLRKAPVAILVAYDASSDNTEYKDYLLSGAAAMQNMLLAAHGLGLGGCFVCHLPAKKTLAKLFGIPSGFEPVGLVVLGHPAIQPKPMPRLRKLEETMAFNEFPAAQKPLSGGIKLATKRLARKIYYLLPSLIKRKLEPVADKFEKKFEN